MNSFAFRSQELPPPILTRARTNDGASRTTSFNWLGKVCFSRCPHSSELQMTRRSVRPSVRPRAAAVGSSTKISLYDGLKVQAPCKGQTRLHHQHNGFPFTHTHPVLGTAGMGGGLGGRGRDTFWARTQPVWHRRNFSQCPVHLPATGVSVITNFSIQQHSQSSSLANYGLGGLLWPLKHSNLARRTWRNHIHHN